ncbi:hypothetical protein SAMN05192561_1227 [Halopenitus malekzadehii]|uniref:Uncharacterized protein n=1 Tax=Halopenitus malekzadehii TaxID=1267564 RepID=A0A1H6JZT1_9EURY|nr:hypothetical protein [Halopenitus malekzadehii]SEH65522.1 hypothetical protein SAMN05192561_1227 [Halopenitus malekzadehii]
MIKFDNPYTEGDLRLSVLRLSVLRLSKLWRRLWEYTIQETASLCGLPGGLHFLRWLHDGREPRRRRTADQTTEKLQIPVFENQKLQFNFPINHPLYVGASAGTGVLNDAIDAVENGQLASLDVRIDDSTPQITGVYG